MYTFSFCSFILRCANVPLDLKNNNTLNNLLYDSFRMTDILLHGIYQSSSLFANRL